ncbi:MAG: hypothetical protein A2048_10680 [Deltaproteobacteria bacterium GWA2_45_12]|nr:MAG: hypothetical protein A2048_10680 [Deltaproteobacteria bacterium GWA2_45_12]
MSSDLFNKVKRYVVESFTKAEDLSGLRHFERTVYWVKKLRPRASEALLVAAIAHDIERAFRDKSYTKISKSSKGFKDDGHLISHQENGARLVGDFLAAEGASKKLINSVKELIGRHEVGGNKDQNLLKDADSVSFFENNIEYFVTKQVEKTNREKVKEKFDWMFNRITSAKAKKSARPWYENGLKKLGY